MPLIKSKSKKAFESNLKSEMHAGKPKDQSLAIAYEIQRKNRKKMYKGGELSAKDEMESTVNNARTDRDTDMMDDQSPMHTMEINFRDEKQSDIDNSRDEREMDMMKPKARFARGGEVDMRDETLASNSIDAAHTDRDEDMIENRSRSHMAERRAASGMSYADEAKTDRDEDMLMQKGQPDEYSKEGIINYADGGEVEPMDTVDAIMQRRRGLKSGEVDLNRNADEDLNYEDQLSYASGRKQNYSEEAGLKELDEPYASNLKGHNAEDDHDMNMVDEIRRRMKAKRGM